MQNSAKGARSVARLLAAGGFLFVGAGCATVSDCLDVVCAPLVYHTTSYQPREDSHYVLCGLVGWRAFRGRVHEHWVAPFYYKGEGVATPLWGSLGESVWLTPVYYFDAHWSANLLYATRDDATAGEHSLVMPWLLTWHEWNDPGGSDLYSPLFGWIGRGTSQTNSWWATPLVGTRAGRREGGWLFPLVDCRVDPSFDDQAQIVGAERLPIQVRFTEETARDSVGRPSRTTLLRGSVASEDVRTYLCLFDDDRLLTDSLLDPGGAYRCTYVRKIGNRILFHDETRVETTFDRATRRRTDLRETSETSVLWRLFRWARGPGGACEVDVLYLPVWRETP